MKSLNILILAVLSALALTLTNPAKAGTTGTSEEIREARKIYLSLCIKDPICNQELENKKEEKRQKELEKIRKDIARLQKSNG